MSDRDVHVALGECGCLVAAFVDLGHDPDRPATFRAENRGYRHDRWGIDRVRKARVWCGRCEPSSWDCTSGRCTGTVRSLAVGAGEDSSQVEVGQCGSCGRIVEREVTPWQAETLFDEEPAS